MLRRHTTRCSTFLCLVLMLGAVTLGAPSPLGAQPSPDAQAAAELLDVEAQALYDEGNFRGALARWKRAYEIYPNPATLWNIARCYEQTREWPQAKGAFGLYLKFESIAEKDRQDAAEHIAQIDAALDRWDKLNQQGQRRFEAGDFVGAESVWTEALEVYPAPTTLWNLARAEQKAGKLEAARGHLKRYLDTPNLSPADSAGAKTRLDQIEAALAAPVDDKKPDPVPVEPDPPDDSRILVGWVATGLGVAGLATGGILRLNIGSDLDEVGRISGPQGATESTDDFNARLGAFEELKDSIQFKEVMMWTAFGVGGASLVVGGTLLYLGYNDVDEREASPSGARLLLSPEGVHLVGWF